MRKLWFKWRFYVILVLLILFCGYIVKINVKHYLSYEFLGSCERKQQVSGCHWFVASKGGFANLDNVPRNALLPDGIDYDATYVVCHGGTLEGIYYKEASHYGNGEYRSYYAYPIIREAEMDMMYVYKLNTDVRIDYNIHDSFKQFATILPKEE